VLRRAVDRLRDADLAAEATATAVA
jgi:hypothetical protein